jgi:hypothetical protein
MTDTIATLLEREGATVVRVPALAEAVVDATAEIKAWTETLSRIATTSSSSDRRRRHPPARRDRAVGH